MGENIKVSTATGWDTRPIKPVSAYRCKSVSETLIFQFSLLANSVQTRNKGSIYLNFLASNKPISQTLTPLLVAPRSPSPCLFISSFFSSFLLYPSVLYWLWPDVWGGQGRSTWAGIIWNWWWKFRSQPPLAIGKLLPFILLHQHHLFSLSLSFFFIFLAAAQLVSPFFILQSHMITTLQVLRIKGFRGHKLSSEWISSRGNFFPQEWRTGWERWNVVWQAYKCQYGCMKWARGRKRWKVDREISSKSGKEAVESLNDSKGNISE